MSDTAIISWIFAGSFAVLWTVIIIAVRNWERHDSDETYSLPKEFWDAEETEET